MTATPDGPAEVASRFTFDEFVVDSIGRTLFHHGTAVPLNSKAFDTLLLLVSNAGETVAKETLLEAVWPGVAVEENNLNQAVSALRKALGDTASPRRFIITVPNRGYRFVRPVAIAPRDAEAVPVVAALAAAAPTAVRVRGEGRLAVRALLAGGIMGLVAIAAWWAPHAVRYSSGGLRGAELTRAVPITSEPGDEEWPRFSPDGTRIAFLWRLDPPDASAIAVKTLGSDSVTRITHTPGGGFHPVWSPDGQSIAFQRGLRTPGPITQVCLVPATGGDLRVLHSQPWSVRPGLAWWAAADALILPVRSDAHAPFHLAALDLRTLRTRPLTSPPPAPLLTNAGDALPAISPDGRLLAFARQTHEGMDIYISDLAAPSPPIAGAVGAAGAAARRLTFERYDVLGLEWHPSGDSVIVSSPRSGVPALYRVMLSDGAFTRLPNVDDGATQPAVDPSSGRLAFRQQQLDTNIYRVDISTGAGSASAGSSASAGGSASGSASGGGIGSRARRIIASSRLDDSPHVSPDGKRIAFESSRSGAREIWVTDAEGGHPRQVTFLHGRAAKPQWSPDGRSIAFDAITPGRVRPDIYVIAAGAGSPRALTADASVDQIPTWAADGKSLYFMSDRSGAWEIWNVPIAGGVARRVTDGGALRAQESADGSSLFYATDTPEVKRRMLGAAPDAALAARDASIARFPADTHWGGDWTITARGLYFLNDHLPVGRAIEFLPFRFSRPGTSPGEVIGTARPVRVAFPTARAAERASFSVAPDESWLVYSQEDYSSRDIMLLARVP